MNGRVVCGTDVRLEEMADEILRKNRAETTRSADNRPYLTDDQLRSRQAREVFNVNGFPDPSICQGLFRRAHNPAARARQSSRREEDL